MFSLPPARNSIEDSRQFLFLVTDILRKTVVGMGNPNRTYFSVVNILHTSRPLTNQLKSCLKISVFDFHLNVKFAMSTSIFHETARKNCIKVNYFLSVFNFMFLSNPDWLPCHGYRNTLGYLFTKFNYMGGFILLFDVSVDISSFYHN